MWECTAIRSKRKRGSEKKKLLWLVMNGTRFLSVYIYINVYTYIYIYTYMRPHCSALTTFHLVLLRVVKFLRSAAGTRSVTCVR